MTDTPFCGGLFLIVLVGINPEALELQPYSEKVAWAWELRVLILSKIEILQREDTEKSQWGGAFLQSLHLGGEGRRIRSSKPSLAT